jgi:hypothetical protein
MMTIIAAPNPVPPGVCAAIQAAGHSVALVRAGEWEVDDPVAVQAIIDAYVGSAAELAYRKREALDALIVKYAGVIAAGRIYAVAGGLDPAPHLYQIDEVPPFDTDGKPSRRDSQSTMTTMAAWAANVLNAVPGAVAWPSPFAWRDANNQMVPMTAAQCFAFTQNVGVYVAGAFGVYAVKYAQIAGAADVAAVAAIDVNAGWPENP